MSSETKPTAANPFVLPDFIYQSKSFATGDHFALNARVNNAAGNTIAKDEKGARFVFTKQLPLIVSEFRELLKGIRERNVKEVRDGVADVIVTAEGMLHRFGLGGYGAAIPHFDGDLSVVKASTILKDSAEILTLLQSPAYDNVQFGALLEVGEEEWRISHEHIQPYIRLVANMYALSGVLHLPLFDDQWAVYESNMSKFDTDLETAKQGIAKYEAAGIAVRLQENDVEGTTYFVIKSAKDQIVGGKDYPEGKFLKSVLFFEPKLLEIDDQLVLGELPITIVEEELI